MNNISYALSFSLLGVLMQFNCRPFKIHITSPVMTVNLFIMCFSPAKQAEYNPTGSPTGVSFEDTTDALPSHVITETGDMQVSSDQQTTLSRTAASQQDTQGSGQHSLPSH